MAFDYRIVLAAMQMKYSSLKGQGNPRSVNTLDFFFFLMLKMVMGYYQWKFFFFSLFHFITRVRRSKPTILDKLAFSLNLNSSHYKVNVKRNNMHYIIIIQITKAGIIYRQVRIYHNAKYVKCLIIWTDSTEKNSHWAHEVNHKLEKNYCINTWNNFPPGAFRWQAVPLNWTIWKLWSLVWARL